MTWRDLGFAALAGLMLGSLFPPFTFEAIAWVALFPLLWVLDEKPPLEGAILGFVTGFIGYLIIIWWVAVTMVNYGGLLAPLAWLLALTLAGYIGLFVAAFGYLLAWLTPSSGYSRMFMGPVIWVALEIVRAYFLSGFPWALLGYSQYRVLPVIQIADLVGVYGISFFIVLVNSILWHFFRHTDRAPYVVLGGGVIAAAIVVGYGYLRLHELPKEMGPPRPVGIVQPDTRPDQKWEPGRRAAIVGELTKLTGKLSEDFKKMSHPVPPLIVWPEAAAPFVYSEEPGWQKRLAGLARRTKSHILFGSLSAKREGEALHLYNSAYLLGPGGENEGRYDKMHLVPFGEYVPLKWLLFFVEKFVPVIGRFEGGEEARIFDVPGGRFGVLICFEVIFPRVVRQMSKAGFLVNITNDAWFGRTAASEQHLSMVAMRAVEFRTPIVRAANTGISAIVEASGAVRFRSPLFEKWRKADTVSPRTGPPTIYARIGDTFAILCFVMTLLAGWLAWIRRHPRL